MVSSDLNQRVQGTVQQFQAQGIDLGQWLVGERARSPISSSSRCVASRRKR